MSLRNRARKLMRATGLSYQQALGKLRALGKSPAELRAQTGWPLEKCDQHLVRLKEGPNDLISLSHDSVSKNSAKIEVVTVESRTRAELACQQLLHTSGAHAVTLLDGWRVLAHAWRGEGPLLLHPLMLKPRGERLPRQPKTMDLGGTLHARIVPIKKLHLAVIYDDSVNQLLLDKRIEKAVEFLDALIEEDPLLAPPDSGNSGNGGPSAVAWESVEIWKKKS